MDFGDRVECVGTPRERPAVVRAPVVYVGIELGALAVEQGVDLAEPAGREQGQSVHFHVAAGQLRRLAGAAVLKERVAPVGRVVVGVALHVVVQPVGELVGGAPGVPRLDGLEPAGRNPYPPQPVVLHVVAHLHRKDHAEAEDGKYQRRQGPAHPDDQPVPEGQVKAVTPERIGVVKRRQSPARQSPAFEFPGPEQVVGHLRQQVLPEAHALGRRSRVKGRADVGVMDVNVLGRIVRVGDRTQQELAQSALPNGTPVDQLVADDEDRLRGREKDAGRQEDLPGGHVAGDQHLPQRIDKQRGPQNRPDPERKVVKEQLVLAGRGRIHVPLFEPEELVELVGEHQERDRTGKPPAAIGDGQSDQRKCQQRNEVRKGVPDRRFDPLPARRERRVGAAAPDPRHHRR